MKGFKNKFLLIVLLFLAIFMSVEYYTRFYMPYTDREGRVYDVYDRFKPEGIQVFQGYFAAPEFSKDIWYTDDYIVGVRFLMHSGFYRLKNPKKEYYQLYIFDRQSPEKEYEVIDLFDLLSETQLKRHRPKDIWIDLFKDSKQDKSYLRITVRHRSDKKSNSSATQSYFYDLETKELLSKDSRPDARDLNSADSTAALYRVRRPTYWSTILERSGLPIEGLTPGRRSMLEVDRAVLPHLTLGERYPHLVSVNQDIRFWGDEDMDWTLEQSHQFLDLLKRKEQANFMDGLLADPSQGNLYEDGHFRWVVTLDNQAHVLKSFEDYNRYVYHPQDLPMVDFLAREDVQAILQDEGSSRFPLGVNILDNSVFTIDLADRNNMYIIDDDYLEIPDFFAIFEAIQAERKGRHYYEDLFIGSSDLTTYTELIDNPKEVIAYDSKILPVQNYYDTILEIEEEETLEQLFKLLTDGKKANLLTVLQISQAAFEKGDVTFRDEVYDRGYLISTSDVKNLMTGPYRITDPTSLHLATLNKVVIFVKDGKMTPIQLAIPEKSAN